MYSGENWGKKKTKRRGVRLAATVTRSYTTNSGKQWRNHSGAANTVSSNGYKIYTSNVYVQNTHASFCRYRRWRNAPWRVLFFSFFFCYIRYKTFPRCEPRNFRFPFRETRSVVFAFHSKALVNRTFSAAHRKWPSCIRCTPACRKMYWHSIISQQLLDLRERCVVMKSFWHITFLCTGSSFSILCEICTKSLK